MPHVGKFIKAHRLGAFFIVFFIAFLIILLIIKSNTFGNKTVKNRTKFGKI